MKHPAPVEAKEAKHLHGPMNKVPNFYFNDINEITVWRATSLTKGSGGLSHVDSDHFLSYAIEQKVQSRIKKFKRTNCFISMNISIDFC